MSSEVLYENLNVQSGENSPASSIRTPHQYIPISECFSGKPVFLSGELNRPEASYSNTLFPFPPKVNWATHPARKDSNSNCTGLNDKIVPPPRPPKKTPVATFSMQQIVEGESLVSIPCVNGEHKCENVEECQDSSSTCSSTPTSECRQIYSPQSSSIGHTCAFTFSPNGETPPRIDRSLKPSIVSSPCTVADSSDMNRSPSHFPSSHMPSNKSMTLPSRGSHQSPSTFVGPPVDRSRKPDDAIRLAPTPAQLAGNRMPESSRSHSMKTAISTLPSGRRNGPKLSPKNGTNHFDHGNSDLQGTYTKIECHNESLGKSGSSVKSGAKKGVMIHHSDDVEYRMIDHDRTKALNKMKQDREQQLRSNTIPKSY